MKSLDGLTADYLYRNCRLCSAHFEDVMFMNIHDKKSLRHDAVPSLFAVPNPPKPNTTQRRLPTRNVDVVVKKRSKLPQTSTAAQVNSMMDTDIGKQNGKLDSCPIGEHCTLSLLYVNFSVKS